MKKVNPEYKVFKDWEIGHNPMQSYALINKALENIKDLRGFGGMEDLECYLELIEDALKCSHMCIINLSIKLFELDVEPGTHKNQSED